MQRFQTVLRTKNVLQRAAVFDVAHMGAAARRQASQALATRSMSSLPDHEVVGLPSLSPTMETGTIAKWNKKEGDAISAGDVVLEVETDKAVVDFEAQDDSFLAKILAHEGEADIPVGVPIFVTVENQEDVAVFKDFIPDTAPAVEAAPAPVEEAPVAEQPKTPAATSPATSPASSSDRVIASPLAKKLARESGAVLSVINGTGPHGRVIKADVEAALAAGTATESASPASESTAPAQETTTSSSSTASSSAATDYVDYPISGEAQALATQLAQQKLDVPHYHLTASLTIDKLLDARARLNAGRGEDEQLSVNDFVVRAASLAMRKVPGANASFKGSFIRQFRDVNVNLLVNTTAGGMVAPVLPQVNRKGLDDISKEIQAAVAKAQDGAFEPTDLANGTFTISNVGMYDVQSLAGIVRPDQACLLGLGAIEKKVVPNDDPDAEQIYKYAQVLTATLACDHRVIDGAVGAQWLASFKELVEDPLKMIL